MSLALPEQPMLLLALAIGFCLLSSRTYSRSLFFRR